MGLLRKGELSLRTPAGGRPLVDVAFSGEYPVLWSYMTQDKWEDGSPRQTSSLLIFASDGMLKGMLRDRDAGLCLWAASDTVLGLFGALEGALCDPASDWRVDRQQAGQQAKRVKRGS